MLEFSRDPWSNAAGRGPRAGAPGAAIAAAEAAAANTCPTPISTANAQNRCSAAGSFFAPTAIPNVQVQQSQGGTAAERAATHLKRVGNGGSAPIRA